MHALQIFELILILLVAFVIVGPKDLPKVARALGRAVRYLRNMFNEFKDETGLDQTLAELKETQRDLDKTFKEADPRKELVQARKDVEQAAKETEKDVKAGLNPTGK